MKELKRLKNLRALNLERTAVTDAGFKELRGLNKLDTLTVSAAQVTDATLKLLREAGLLHTISQARGQGDEQSRRWTSRWGSRSREPKTATNGLFGRHLNIDKSERYGITPLLGISNSRRFIFLLFRSTPVFRN
jgi:hypothetical protein